MAEFYFQEIHCTLYLTLFILFGQASGCQLRARGKGDFFENGKNCVSIFLLLSKTQKKFEWLRTVTNGYDSSKLVTHKSYKCLKISYL